MSSLVFVRDAQGRPLMPMSAAYARTLIQQGKATVWPHPAFSVIQLTRVVAAPTLRPVLVGLALTTTVADLVVVIDQLRGSPSTLHIVVDLRFLPLLRDGQQGLWKPRRRRTPFPQPGQVSRPSDRVRMVLEVLRMCYAVMPISHLVLLPSARTTALTPPHAWWMEHRVAAGVRCLDGSISVVHGHTKFSGEAPYWLLRPLEEQMFWAVRRVPQLVASAKRPDSESGFSIHQRWERKSHPAHHVIHERSVYTVGRLYTTRYHRRTITGVLQALDAPDHLILRVPTQVTDQGVQWQPIQVPITPSVHLWPRTSMSLLPLVKV